MLLKSTQHDAAWEILLPKCSTISVRVEGNYHGTTMILKIPQICGLVAHSGTLFGNCSVVFSTCTVCIILLNQPGNTHNIPQTKFRHVPKTCLSDSKIFQVALLQLLQRLQPLPKLAPPHLNAGQAGEGKVDQGEIISTQSR